MVKKVVRRVKRPPSQFEPGTIIGDLSRHLVEELGRVVARWRNTAEAVMSSEESRDLAVTATFMLAARLVAEVDETPENIGKDFAWLVRQTRKVMDEKAS